jgi:gamma-glutamyltranspeptidase/glutathione hydrolase
VIDRNGNAVALTTTVNGYFGSGVVTKKSGIILNNQIDDFAIKSGQANMFGLVQSDYNLVAPGKRPLSSMTPVLVFLGDKVVGCAGGAGGPRIISGTFESLLNAFVFKMNAQAAVSAPRVHHQWLPAALSVEKEIPRDVIRALEQKGHKVDVSDTISAIQMIVVRGDGVREAASDPRKGGRPAAEPSRQRRARP